MIYTVDETGITTVQSPSRITDPKRVKQIAALTRWERRKKVTACCSFSAEDHYIPPIFVLPRKRISP
jgi:hypothetical protein